MPVKGKTMQLVITLRRGVYCIGLVRVNGANWVS
jgi:hypothetical protein